MRSGLIFIVRIDTMNTINYLEYTQYILPIMHKAYNLGLALIIVIFFSFLFSSTSQAVFNKNPLNPLINIGLPGSWDANLVSAPSTLFNSDGFKSWYYGSSANLAGNIGLATSMDGLLWNKNVLNPVLTKDPTDPSELEIAESSVLKVGNEYKMWYLSTEAHNGPGDETYRIKYATSSDGVNWTRHGFALRRRAGVTWESEGVMNPTVLYVNGQYKMWYGTRDSAGIGKIGYAFSSDGVSWNRIENPVLQASLSWEGTSVGAASAYFDGKNYHLYYHAGPVVPLYIGHAVSTDGINWSKESNPILERGGFGAWDQNLIAAPDVLRVYNKLRLYYGGRDTANLWRIGLAEELLPVPYYSQKDPLWKDDQYDHTNKDMESLGCAVTSAAMVLRYFDVKKTPGNPTTGLAAKELTPGTLNEWMKSKNDAYFRNGSTNWALISKLTSLSHDLDPTSPKLEYFSTHSAQLAAVLSQESPAILSLPHPDSPSNTHFVVATDPEESSYKIHDPFYDTRTTLLPHYSTINRVGFYKLTNTDFSYFIFAVNPEVMLSLKDSHGQEVGDQFIENPIFDAAAATSSGQPLKMLYFKAPPLGNYTLEVSAPSNTAYQLDAYLYNVDGEGGMQTFNGTAIPQKSVNYNIQFGQGTNPTITEIPPEPEVVTFDKLKSDIEYVYTQGWINKGTRKLLLTLTELAHKADKKGKIKVAVAELKAIEVVLKGLRWKHITREGYSLLHDDVVELLKKYSHSV